MDSALDGWISNGWWWMVVSTFLQEGWCMNRVVVVLPQLLQAKIMGCLQETLGSKVRISGENNLNWGSSTSFWMR